MRRIAQLVIFMALITVTLIACDDKKPIPEVLDLQSALETIEIASEIEAHIALPTTIAYQGKDIQITWTSSNVAIINTHGSVTRPSAESGDAVVTLTALATYETLSKSMDFVLTVKALPVVIEEVTVTFDSQGGSLVSSVIVTKGQAVSKPADPTKEGHTFIGWSYSASAYSEVNFNAVLLTNVTYYAFYEADIMTFTVSFWSNGSLVQTVEVEENTAINAFPTPTLAGHRFIGWSLTDGSTTLFNETSLIQSALTLYAIFEEEVVLEGTPISTVEAFNAMANTGGSGVYYLANDLDFTGYTWTYVNSLFTGTLNGNGKMLSNLTITASNVGGIFGRLNGAYIHDIVLDNVHVSSVAASQRAGLIAGQTDGANNQLTNIHILNSSVEANRQEGAGLLLGQAKHLTHMDNILIEDSQVTNQSNNAGGLIGQVDGTHIHATNIQMQGVSVKSMHSSDARAGGLFGEMKNGGMVHVRNAFLDIIVEGKRYVGGITGRHQTSSDASTLEGILITGSILNTGTSSDAGHLSGQNNFFSVVDAYVVNLTQQGSFNRQNVIASNVISDFDILDQMWYQEHIPSFDASPAWEYKESKYHLVFSAYVQPGSFEVTYVFGHNLSNEILYLVESQKAVAKTHVDLLGYRFEGWYTDSQFTAAFDFSTSLYEATTLYAKWTTIPTYLITYNGSSYRVNEQTLIDEPQALPITNKIFVGYFVDGVAFDFSTPITQDITLEAVYRDAETYLLELEGDGEVVDNYIATEGVKVNLPVLNKEGYRFVGWYLDTDYAVRFDQDYVNQSMKLYARFTEAGTVHFEETFDYAVGTLLRDTPWVEAKAGNSVMASYANDTYLAFTELADEAIYTQPLSVMGQGRYVLAFTFAQGTGGASFTIELVNNTTRIFTVGANRQNRYTYRLSDGSEFAVPLTSLAITPHQIYQAMIVFDTEFNYYKYFVSDGIDLIEVTPEGGVAFASDLSINAIRVRTAGHKGTPSAQPITYINNILIESSSETELGKSDFDPEAAIDYNALLDEIQADLTIPFMDNIRGNIALRFEIERVSISYVSSHPSIVSTTGIVNRLSDEDAYVTLTATIEKAGFVRTKTFNLVVKSQLAGVEFEDSHYDLSGFALNHVSIPNITESDPAYYVAYNEQDFLRALAAENKSDGTRAAKIIEIRADLNLGYNEVLATYPEFGSLSLFSRHAVPKMHPTLIASGVSQIYIQDRNASSSKYGEGLMIFSEAGHTIKHASFNIKRADNVIIRNLKFDELWEWDEATKGNYDSNDWDYFTLDTINGIWFDHVEFNKAYDGLIDFKAGSTTNATVKNATFSYLKAEFVPNQFILDQFLHLEANRSQYSYYNAMRNAGMTMEEIMQINSFQKKGFLLGGSELRAGNVFTLSIYNSYFKNLQDRFPRLRGGDVHVFNNIYDASDVYATRNDVIARFPALFAQDIYKRQLTNQMLVTTEQGAIYMENTIVKGVSQVIKSNQVSRDHPLMTGKYLVMNSYYELGDYTFFGSSLDANTPFIRSNSEPILNFSWNSIQTLPYDNYTLVDVNVLEAYLFEEAIIGTTSQPFNWKTLTY